MRLCFHVVWGCVEIKAIFAFLLLLLIRLNHAHIELECNEVSTISRLGLFFVFFFYIKVRLKRLKPWLHCGAQQWARFVSNYDTESRLDFNPNCLSNLNGFWLTNGVKLTLHHVTMCCTKVSSTRSQKCTRQRIENMTNFRPWMKPETILCLLHSVEFFTPLNEMLVSHRGF